MQKKCHFKLFPKDYNPLWYNKEYPLTFPKRSYISIHIFRLVTNMVWSKIIRFQYLFYRKIFSLVKSLEQLNPVDIINFELNVYILFLQNFLAFFQYP